VTNPGAAAGVRLGTAIARVGSKVREDSLAKTTPALAQVAMRVVEVRAEKSAKAMLGGLDAWLQENASNSPLPPAVAGLFRGLFAQFGMAVHTAISTAIGFGVGTALGAVLEPKFAEMAQASWSGSPVQVFDTSTLAEEIVRGHRTVAESEKEASKTGYDRNRLTRAVRLARARLPLGEVLELLNRRTIDEEAARGRLELLGFGSDAIEEVLTLRRRVPPATDVVRFAVREVYNPPLRDALGYGEEFDELTDDAIRDAEAAGVTRDDLFKYWVAHWQLPSPEQAYRMLWRGLITEDQLRELLKASDYPVTWRERLQAIAYIKPGRVDLRRMFAAGVIEEREVLDGYLDQGYERINAERLTEFAVAEAMEPDRVLAKGEVLTLYESGHLSEPVAGGMLRDLGYTEQLAGFLLGLAEARRERSYRDRVLGTIHTRFVARKIDEDEAQTFMDRLGIEARARTALLELWDLERDAAVPELTEVQVRTAWRQGHVTEDYYRDWLLGRGYSDDEVYLILQLAGAELTETTVRGAWKKGAITEEQYVDWLRSHRYDEGEIALLVSTHRPTPPAAPA
jgi:hypothetical protein